MLNRSERLYFSIGLALIIVFLIVELLNGRLWMNDMRVYVGAAEALRNNTPVYGVTFGLESGFFKYAPATLYPFLVLTLLPIPAAQILYFICIGICALLSTLLTRHLVAAHSLTPRVRPVFLLLAITLLAAVHWHRELHLGNINLPILLLLLLAYRFLLQERWLSVSLAIAVALLFKPHFLLLIPLLLWHKRWREALGSIAITILLLGSSFLVFGINKGQDLHTAWISTMIDHNALLFYTGGEAREALNTVYTVIYNGILYQVIEAPTSIHAWLVLTVIGSLVGSFLLWERYKRKHHSPSDTPLQFMWFWGLALVPSITLTDTNHFLFSLPLIAWVITRWFPIRKNIAFSTILVAVLFAYAGNWNDLWGEFSNTMRDVSLLGIGNVSLLTLAMVLRIQEVRQCSKPTGASSN